MNKSNDEDRRKAAGCVRGPSYLADELAAIRERIAEELADTRTAAYAQGRTDAVAGIGDAVNDLTVLIQADDISERSSVHYVGRDEVVAIVNRLLS